MTTPSGASFFDDVYNVTFLANAVTTNIYAVSSIGIQRDDKYVWGRDNIKLRPVAGHIVAVDDKVTIATKDLNTLVVLLSLAGYPGTLTFNIRAAAHNYVGSNQLADQTCTITGLVINSKSFSQPMQGEGSFTISGTVVEGSSDSTDPIAFAVASSPPTETQN